MNTMSHEHPYRIEHWSEDDWSKWTFFDIDNNITGVLIRSSVHNFIKVDSIEFALGRDVTIEKAAQMVAKIRQKLCEGYSQEMIEKALHDSRNLQENHEDLESELAQANEAVINALTREKTVVDECQVCQNAKNETITSKRKLEHLLAKLFARQP